MNQSLKLEVIATSKYGIVVECNDIEVADQFDDFLTTNFRGEFTLKFEASKVSFFMGRGAPIEKIRQLCKIFLEPRT